MNLEQICQELINLADAEDAKNLMRFFKTGAGGYGAGDQFRGIRVPVLRRLARQARSLAHADVLQLILSPYHEDRLLALLIWVEQYRRGDATRRQQIFDDYLAHTARINNWDLVDSSAEHLVGAHLFAAVRQQGPSDLLTRLAASDLLWERRIAIMATFHFIKQEYFVETLRVADLLLHDRHDLIHKAVGWMLREVGQHDLATEVAFLAPRYKTMPRTMLRYAIEHFPEEQRQAYPRGEV